MNIIFLLKTLNMGGVEVVSAVLANKFAKEGHNVGVFTFCRDNNTAASRFDQKIKIEVGNGYKFSKANVSKLQSMLKDYEANVVINQWGLPLIPIRTLKKASMGMNIKIISVFHNDPLRNGRLQNIDNKILSTTNPLKKAYLKIQRALLHIVTGHAMLYVYNHSDLFGVLSQSYINNFQQLTGIKSTQKIVVLTNPVTIDYNGFVYNHNEKRKEIIYVGRIDNTQKNVYRIIETWSNIEKDFKNWQLTIIGDGPDKNDLEQKTDNLELRHIKFEGIQNPRPYYERASILLLTSDFEGFPLVIAECMSFGVVPIVYGSFSAVYDIIENGNDGFIVAKMNGKFNIDKMSECLKDLMQNQDMLNYMAKNAITKSQQYSIDNIYSQYMKYME